MSEEKVILLTKNKRLHNALLQSLRQKNLVYETTIPALNDFDHITQMIKITKNTLFLGEAFNNFIKANNCTPLCIILDYKMDFGLPKELDPDNMRLLKAFTLSSAVLINMTNLDCNVMNIILIGEPQYVKQLDMFKLNPHLIYKIVKTENPQLNHLLDKVIQNSEIIKNLLTIDYLLIDESKDFLSTSKKLDGIIDKLLQKKKSMMNLKNGKDQTEILSGQFEPAKLLFKISDSRLYVDGKIFNIENNPKFEKYRENIIYLLGYYVHNNVLQVNEKIEKFLLDDYPRIKKMSEDAEVNINIEDHTIIDGGIAPALNILLSIKLKDFRNIRLITSPLNFGKMENSPGFISLRNYILKK